MISLSAGNRWYICSFAAIRYKVSRIPSYLSEIKIIIRHASYSITFLSLVALFSVKIKLCKFVQTEDVKIRYTYNTYICIFIIIIYFFYSWYFDILDFLITINISKIIFNSTYFLFLISFYIICQAKIIFTIKA